jgi:hypothetical protein
VNANTQNTIRNIKSSEKIAFLLVTYAVRADLQEKEKARLESLASIRNRLLHFGQFPEQKSTIDDAVLFVRMTEMIVAKTLGLTPSPIFNTLEKLEEFIANPPKISPLKKKPINQPTRDARWVC